MKKKRMVLIILVVTLFFGFVAVQPLMAAIRVVELKVPGCG